MKRDFYSFTSRLWVLLKQMLLTLFLEIKCAKMVCKLIRKQTVIRRFIMITDKRLHTKITDKDYRQIYIYKV